jgi:hypothetical protein
MINPFALAFLLLGLLISAVVLRAACHFLKVKEPNLLPAMGIVFLVALIGWGINSFLGFAIGLAIGPRQVGSSSTVSQLFLIDALGLIINQFVAAVIYWVMFPGATFAKGIAIFWLQVLISAALAALAALPFYFMGFFAEYSLW